MSSDPTVDSILKRPGPDVAVTAGASEFVPGDVRYPFLVIRNDAKPVERPAATVWLARSRADELFAHATARLEPIGVPGRSEAAFGGVTQIYVAHLRIPRPGRYWLVAQPEGAKIQAVGVLDVKARSSSTAVGARAPALGDADARNGACGAHHHKQAARPPVASLLDRGLARSARAVRRHLRYAEALHEPHLRPCCGRAGGGSQALCRAWCPLHPRRGLP
jgi:hypothetical protein